jgi:Asp-tRNA(Asn)/Glu-tRNA(Gln) amidotransferase B subunit
VTESATGVASLALRIATIARVIATAAAAAAAAAATERASESAGLRTVAGNMADLAALEIVSVAHLDKQEEERAYLVALS